MKKVLTILLFVITIVSLVSCGKPNTPPEGDGDGDDTPNTPNLPETDECLGFAIHYDQTSKVGEQYKYNLWIWEPNGSEGADCQFNEEDDYGVVARFEWTDFESSTIKQNGIGFIVKENKVWAESPVKDIDSDRFINFNNYEQDKYGYYNIYLKYGDENIYTSADGGVSDIIQYFSLAYNKVTGFKIWFQTNKDFESYQIKLGDEVVYSSETEQTIVPESRTSKKVVYVIGKEVPNLKEDYYLEVKFKESQMTYEQIADMSPLYETEEFTAKYTYDGDLGAIYANNETIFRVWSPVSTSVKLRIYNNGTPKSLGGDDVYDEYLMTEGINGEWEKTLNGDLAGKYYTYVVTNSTYEEQEIVDPYAKSTGINGLRGMIVDFSQTNPEGWENVTIHEYPSTSLTVYETHIADLTSSDTWNGTSANSKLMKGFYETGTTYTENGVTVSTGFDHIKELGVNAVQILPIFDQANDERVENREFNWGYNPLNYNSLDGIYSADPYDGYVRIKEFKELVQAYNEAGINIIMDVVYNHVNGLDKSNFDVLMPKYYFRYTSSGPSNGSGCGNETASERAMYRKFMIDSTEFWASEYKLGGFRFDLMGVHDVETMNALANNIHENVSEYVTIYGEPWAGGTIALKGTAASQTAMNQFDGYGCFNDKFRDALIKGGLSSAQDQGWITNSNNVSASDVSDIKNGLTGLILAGNTIREPQKTINYVTCHDNYTLYDRIKAAGITDEATVKKMAMLANSLVFTSQGISFMLAGEEFLRTKGGNSNSYNASYEVNELNYALKVANLDMFENYKKLIALKQNSNLFGLSGEECQNIEININTDGSLIYYDLVDKENNISYRIVHSNGVSSSKVVDLSNYSIYLNTLGNDISLSAATVIEPYQTIIAYKSL